MLPSLLKQQFNTCHHPETGVEKYKFTFYF